jgi:GNAT superfamily N-acetyltransferase
MALMGQLEDLFVKEEHRAQGLGKRLFGELGAIAKERNCGRVEWRVLKVSLVPPASSLPILVVSSKIRHASSFV